LGKKQTLETISKRAKKNSKNWILISPDGIEIYEFEISLKCFCEENKLFCEENKLSYDLLRKYRNKTVPKCRIKNTTTGWSLYEH
jgi:hypothetical protein